MNFRKRKLIAIIFLVFILFLCLELIYSIKINEIMYNPLGNDNNKEYIEFFLDYNDNGEEFSNYVISDKSSNDTLEILNKGNSSYLLVVEEEFNLETLFLDENNITVYSAGSTIGNNLNNDEDCIYLYNSSYLVDSYCYNGSFGNDNGYSMEYFNKTWYESKVLGGTPGFINTIENYINSLNETDITSKEEDTNNTELEEIIRNRVEIIDVYSDSGVIDFDKFLKVKLFLSRGDTRKSVVYIYLYDEKEEKKISEEQKVYLLEKDTFLDLVINIPLKKYTCKIDGFSPKEIVLKAEGLGDIDSYDIDFEFKDFCKEEPIVKNVCEKEVEEQKPKSLNGGTIEKEDKVVLINSFYTRIKKYSETIRLFSNIEFTDDGNYTIIITNNKTVCSKESIEIKDYFKETLDFFCFLNDGDNNFRINISKSTLDKYYYKDFSKVFEHHQLEKEEDFIEKEEDLKLVDNMEDLKLFNQNKDENNNINQITGNLVSTFVNKSIVFDSKEGKGNNIYIYGAVILIAILSLILFFKTKKKKM